MPVLEFIPILELEVIPALEPIPIPIPMLIPELALMPIPELALMPILASLLSVLYWFYSLDLLIYMFLPIPINPSNYNYALDNLACRC
jgi:hypothetical protein